MEQKYIFVDSMMNNLKEILIANLDNHNYTTMADFLYKESYTAWVEAIEAVRVSIANCALHIRNNDSELLKIYKDTFYSSYKRVLRFFTDKSIDFEPVDTVSNYDYKAVLTLIGKGVSTRKYERIQDYLMYGQRTFRRDLENYIANRIVEYSALTYEEKTEKRMYKEPKKAQNKAKKKNNRVSTTNANPTPIINTLSPPLPKRKVNFRYGVWGDNRDIVIAYEKHAGQDKAQQDKDGIIYTGINLWGNEYKVMYIYCTRGLYRGLYMLDDKIQTRKYLRVYNKLKGLLTISNGNPIEDNIRKYDMEMPDHITNIEQIIQLGCISYDAVWKSDNTQIQLILSGDNNRKTVLFIAYTSLDIAPDVDIHCI